MAATEHRFSRYADVVAALAEPALVPVPPQRAVDALGAGGVLDAAGVADAGGAAGAGDAGDVAGRTEPLAAAEGAAAATRAFPPHAVEHGTAAWLRATVARFASGPTHRRRRAIVEGDLDRLDPVRLRRAATRAAASAARTGGAPADARALAVRVLAEAFGLPDPDAVAADVIVVAGVYFGGEDEAADGAVARLMALLLSAAEPLLPGHRSGPAHTDSGLDDSGLDDVSGCDEGGRGAVAEARLEAAANRIGVLVQACDATGILVANAMRALHQNPGTVGGVAVDAVIAETLRHDPPVRTMRRIALRATRIGGIDIDEGDTLTLDIAAANRDPEVFVRPDDFDPRRTAPSLTFGAEPRRCPGRHHAFALAAGILDDYRTRMACAATAELDQVA